MNAKRTIQKILFIMLWLAIGTGMLTLLVAAIGKKNRDVCRNYQIKIFGAQNNLFVDEHDVLNLLTAGSHSNLKGHLISSINLRKLETLLEDNVWIKDAQLYFDNQDVLHINVEESEPVARIFTTAGNSFYINRDKVRMPLSDKVSAKVPVFTNFPERDIVSEDSILLDDLKTTAVFILHDPFWMSQVSQIDISEEGTFEMIPTVGNHLVKLGDGKNIDRKFNRLFVFYKQILSKAGFETYPVIDVQYADQIVATKSGTSKSRVDTSQLRKNVQRMLQDAKEVTEEKLIDEKKINEQTNNNRLSEQDSNETPTNSSELKNGEKHTNPNSLKPTLESGSNEKKETKKKIPRAVMSKRDST